MPGPQSLTPKPSSATRPQRRFTLAQANASLPLVKRIVADIVRSHEEVARQQAALEKASGKKQSPAQSELQTRLAQLQDYVDELQDVGCELKDYKLGLVDFVAKHHGHDVYLCWKLGEETVGYWHEMDAGIAGRQPIASFDE